MEGYGRYAHYYLWDKTYRDFWQEDREQMAKNALSGFPEEEEIWLISTDSLKYLQSLFLQEE